MKTNHIKKHAAGDSTAMDDEQQRRLLQKYIFELEDMHDQADEVSIAHEKIKRSQDLLLKILSSTRQGIILVKDRKIVWCNKGMKDILGWEHTDLIDRSTSILFPSFDEFTKIGSFIYDEPRSDDAIVFEYEFIHKGGHSVPCLVTGQAVDRGTLQKEYVFSIADFTENVKTREALKKAYEELEVRVKQRTAQLAEANRELLKEIEDRRQAEDAAKRSEEKYKNIIESMEDGYFEVDLKGNLVFFNSKFRRMVGYSEDEMMGVNFNELADEECFNTLLESFDKVQTTGRSHRVNACIIVAKHGKRILVETPISLILDENNQPAGFRGLARDVTEKMSLEKRLQRAKRMEAIGLLAGGVAHDLNNILSGIMTYPELILMDLPTDNQLKKDIVAIKESGEKAVSIVQDLLTLARRGVAVQEVTNLNSIILEYLESPEHEKIMFFHPDIRVIKLLDEKLLDISGSPVHLSKTIMNLVSNAAESMPEGGVISILTKNKYLDGPIGGFEEVAKGDYAVLSVTDTGIGIAPEDLSRIFEPFYTKKKMGRSGTGLGMSVVWGTVKDHKGYIDVQSTEGVGTTITLYFPRTWKKPEKKNAGFSLEQYKGNGEFILVIDDVKEQRVIATKLLEKLGYFVAAVSSGEEAVAYLEHNSADLLLLDMIMDPGMDGLETYEKALERHPGQKAVITSGFSETFRVRKTQELGARYYLKKPYNLKQLAQTIKKALKDEHDSLIEIPELY